MIKADMDKIDELLTRGVANIIPGRAELEKVLRSDKNSIFTAASTSPLLIYTSATPSPCVSSSNS